MPGPEDTLPLCEDVQGDKFCVYDREQAIKDIAVYVGAVAGTGRTGPATPAEPDQPSGTGDGREVFVDNCGSCHTLADAGTTGTIGPNLDESRPSRELAVDRVTNGKGAMPPFRETLSPEQIQAVAEYVANAAGS